MKFVMTVNIKYRNDQICPECAENKVKQSNFVNYLVNPREALENLSFLCLIC